MSRRCRQQMSGRLVIRTSRSSGTRDRVAPRQTSNSRCQRTPDNDHSSQVSQQQTSLIRSKTIISETVTHDQTLTSASSLSTKTSYSYTACSKKNKIKTHQLVSTLFYSLQDRNLSIIGEKIYQPYLKSVLLKSLDIKRSKFFNLTLDLCPYTV